MSWLIAALSLTLALVACKSTPTAQPSATTKQTAPVATAQVATDTAIAKDDQKNDERDAKLRARVDHAREKNQDNPEGPAKVIVDGDMQVAQALLSDVTADPAETAASVRDALLVESGKTSEARANYAKSAQDATKLAQELAVAQAERDAARAAEKAATAELARRMEENRRANERAIQEARDAERRAFFVWVGRALIVAAIICGLIGAFSTYTTIQSGDIFKAIIRGAVWAGFAAFFIVCGWTINQPWFKWVIIIGGSLVVIVIATLAWINWKDASEKRANKSRVREADEAEDTLVHIMQGLEAKFSPDHDIFKHLQGVMDKPHKALLNELKAERQRAAATIKP